MLKCSHLLDPSMFCPRSAIHWAPTAFLESDQTWYTKSIKPLDARTFPVPLLLGKSHLFNRDLLPHTHTGRSSWSVSVLGLCSTLFPLFCALSALCVVEGTSSLMQAQATHTPLLFSDEWPLWDSPGFQQWLLASPLPSSQKETLVFHADFLSHQFHMPHSEWGNQIHSSAIQKDFILEANLEWALEV